MNRMIMILQYLKIICINNAYAIQENDDVLDVYQTEKIGIQLQCNFFDFMFICVKKCQPFITLTRLSEFILIYMNFSIQNDLFCFNNF